MLQYQINNSALKWSFMFDTLERNADELEIIDYSLSQTSLEQVCSLVPYFFQTNLSSALPGQVQRLSS